MKPSLLKNTTNLPTSVNEYLMKFLFLLSKSWHITNIAPMHQLSCVQTKRKIGSMTTSTRSLSKRHSVTSWSSYEILTLGRENNYIYTIKTGLDSLEGTEWENWTATDYCSEQVCTVQPVHHKQDIPTCRQVQNHLDAPQVQTWAHDWFGHCTPEPPTGCHDHTSNSSSRISPTMSKLC